MNATTASQTLGSVQDGRLRELLALVIGRNSFQTARLRAAGLDGPGVDRAAFLARCPFTTKADLTTDQQEHPPFGSNLTWPLERYVRLSQTSGSNGRPLRWLDTAEDWSGMQDTWERIFRAWGVGAADRVFAAFSFGPFLGFWTAYEAASRLGCLCLPGGGMSSRARLEVMHDAGATVLLATPTYVIRLGEAVRAEGIPVPTLRRIIVGGEPGGSIPATRQRIHDLWPEATVIDHHGMTEIGPVSWQDPGDPGRLLLDEERHLVEVVEPSSGLAVPPGGTGELVLTTLDRIGSPLLRYRTGDLVRLADDPTLPGHALVGGILGRVDDMVVVRGVNVWPAAVEAVVRRFPEVVEFRCLLSHERGMVELRLQIEAEAGADAARLCAEVQAAIGSTLFLRVPVEPVAHGTLPRPEMKSRRWLTI